VKFQQIPLEQSLPSAGVQSIIQDDQGFMWFATYAGVVRYDGYDYVTYTHDPVDSNSIPQGIAQALYCDSEGILWAGTNGGLSQLDPRTNRIQRYMNDPNDSRSLSHNQVMSILEDRSGNIWVGTFGGGVNLLDRKTGEFTRYTHHPTEFIFRMREDPDSSKKVIWLSTSRGLVRFDYRMNLYTRYQHDVPDKNYIHNRFRDISFSADGNIWIGTGLGLDTFFPDSEHFRHVGHSPLDTILDYSSSIRSLELDKSGFLWLGLEDGSLQKMDIKPYDISNAMSIDGLPGIDSSIERMAAFAHYQHDPLDPGSLGSGTFIKSIYEDDAGLLWFGHINGGISKLDPRTKRFISNKHDPTNSNSLNSDNVLYSP
jgi:ligand-binding sensor domain-containing protein